MTGRTALPRDEPSRGSPSLRGPVAHAAAAASVVCAAGFCVLNVLAALRPGPPHLPGLYDFASATWGDGLVLPVMTGSLVYVIGRLPPGGRELPVAIGSALLGASAGVATLAASLAAETPRLNWTFPEPHRFNAVGWYHAGFLVAMSAAATGLWTVAIYRVANVARTPRPVGAALAVATAAAVAFVTLLFADARAAGSTDARGVSVLVALAGLGTALVALAAILVRRARRST
jgi:hypothetical protein